MVWGKSTVNFRIPAAIASLLLAAVTSLLAAPLRAEDGIPSELVRQAEGKLRRELEETSGHSIACLGSSVSCLASYEKLLGFDWRTSPLDRAKKIVLSSRHATGASPDHLVINAKEPQALLEEALGGPLSPATGRALQLLSSLKATSSVAAETALSPCETKSRFYRELFEEDLLDATIVMGYEDSHTETFSGYFAEQFFRTRKIPVFVGRMQRKIAELLELLKQDGFVTFSELPGEWHLSREFHFQGKRKTAVVHLFNATQPCAGEKPGPDGAVYRYDNDLCPEQLEATLKAKNAFRNAFGKSQLIVYNGHARLGRGPDFGPLGREEGKFPLAKGALEKVELGGKKTLLFLGSCDSIRYFRKGIEKKRKTASELHFLGNEGTSYSLNENQDTFRLLKGLMEARCPEELVAELNLPKQVATPYRVLPAGLSDWLPTPTATPAEKELPKYLLTSGKAGGAPQCFATEGSREQPVDDRFCAYSYLTSVGTNGKTSCYRSTHRGIPYGMPVAAEFCQDNSAILVGQIRYQLKSTAPGMEECFALDARSAPLGPSVDARLCGNGGPYAVAVERDDSRYPGPRCYAVSNNGKPTGDLVEDRLCATQYVLAVDSDGFYRCHLATRGGNRFGDAVSLGFCIP